MWIIRWCSHSAWCVAALLACLLACSFVCLLGRLCMHGCKRLCLYGCVLLLSSLHDKFNFNRAKSFALVHIMRTELNKILLLLKCMVRKYEHTANNSSNSSNSKIVTLICKLATSCRKLKRRKKKKRKITNNCYD